MYIYIYIYIHVCLFNIFIHVFNICIFTYLRIMGCTNTNLVRYSRVSCWWLHNYLHPNMFYKRKILQIYKLMVYYNTTEVCPLCRIWKPCTCFGVCISISVIFFVQQVISLLISNFRFFIQT